MDSWERFDEILLPNKEDFYSSLNVEGINHFGYRHAKRVFKEFKMNNLGDCYDLYVQSHALLVLKINLLEYMNLIQLIFIRTSISIASLF